MPRLKVYLGAAPGVGKTYRMLDEGRRRAVRGANVVVGSRSATAAPARRRCSAGWRPFPRISGTRHGGRFEETDLAAVLARRPRVAIVDEFAHSNIPGDGRNPKRRQDIETLLAAGIDVVTALNIQHLESLNDVAEKITGVPQHETVPDEVVRRAWQIELVGVLGRPGGCVHPAPRPPTPEPGPCRHLPHAVAGPAVGRNQPSASSSPGGRAAGPARTR
ncbi:hypothetical protein ACIQGO_16765 [Streptomyces shenzhenensis]|uniref:histidine kinase n=1 Tax=Streptomyces shenzhenensis TaxID=943815 RepID=UPI0038278D74